MLCEAGHTGLKRGHCVAKCQSERGVNRGHLQYFVRTVNTSKAPLHKGMPSLTQSQPSRSLQLPSPCPGGQWWTQWLLLQTVAQRAESGASLHPPFLILPDTLIQILLTRSRRFRSCVTAHIQLIPTHTSIPRIPPWSPPLIYPVTALGSAPICTQIYLRSLAPSSMRPAARKLLLSFATATTRTTSDQLVHHVPVLVPQETQIHISLTQIFPLLRHLLLIAITNGTIVLRRRHQNDSTITADAPKHYHSSLRNSLSFR